MSDLLLHLLQDVLGRLDRFALGGCAGALQGDPGAFLWPGTRLQCRSATSADHHRTWDGGGTGGRRHQRVDRRTDLEGTTSVKFGGVPAAFVQGSENLVVATSPAAAGPVAVPVTVTTIVVTATSNQFFTFQPPGAAPSSPAPVAPARVGPRCAVPNLAGKHLKAAKKKIRAGHRKVGTIVKANGVTAKTGKVVRQSPKVGKTVPVHSAVSLKLG